MKGFFDELIDIYKEVEREIKEEVENQKKLSKPFSKTDNQEIFNKRRDKKAAKKQVVERKVFKPNSVRAEGDQAKDYKNYRTLRDVESNLENKTTYMDRVDTKQSKLGEYSKEIEKLELNNEIQYPRIDNLSDNLASAKVEDLSQNSKGQLNKDVKEITASLKSEDKIKNARKAFLYSEIFNRRKW